MTNKEAITVLENHISPYDECKADNEANQAIRLAIKALEERPQGEWIKEQVTPASCTYVCSECGIEEVILSNFCRYCGADMRGGALWVCDFDDARGIKE